MPATSGQNNTMIMNDTQTSYNNEGAGLLGGEPLKMLQRRLKKHSGTNMGNKNTNEAQEDSPVATLNIAQRRMQTSTSDRAST